AAQIAIVDADERGLERERALQLGPVVHLDQHVHAIVERARLERCKTGVFEGGDDQQDGVCAQSARLGDLIFVDDELLAQRRQRACVARLDQVFGSTLEKGPVGQHREAGRSRLFVRRGDGVRVERIAQDAPARARPLDFRDDCRRTRGDALPDRALEAARRSGGARGRLDLGEGMRELSGDDFFGLGGDDPGQDIPIAMLRRFHLAPAPSFWVAATNWSSFRLAAPDTTAARARSIPSGIVKATFAAYSATPALSTTISRGVPSMLFSASSSIVFDSCASTTFSPRLEIILKPKSSGWISYS